MGERSTAARALGSDDISNAAGEVASDFIAEELAAERMRKSSLETRGFAAITTSAAFVTLLLALAALTTKSSGFVLSAAARWLLVGAAILFVLAAAFGITCNAPAPYLQVNPRSLEVFLAPEVWVEEGTDAKRELTGARLVGLADARTHNDRKGRLALAALILQGSAALVTTIAITLTLIGI